MNIIYIISVIGFFFIGSLRGQTSDGMENFRLKIEKSSTGQEAQDSIYEAFREGDMDKLKVCFVAPKTSSLFLKELDKKSVSPLKDRIILMMLRTPSPFDKKGKNDFESSPPAFPLGMYVAAKYINERSGYDVFDLDDKRALIEAASSLAQRELLAKRLELIDAPQSHRKEEELIEKKEPSQIVAKSRKLPPDLIDKKNFDAVKKPGDTLFWISLGVAIFVFVFAVIAWLRVKLRKSP